MAYSGLGSGTVGDPYQITTTDQFVEMADGSYGNTDYFLLMNDIDFAQSVISQFIFSNLDGGGNQISFSLNANVTYFLLLRTNSIYFQNIRLNITDVGNNLPVILSQDMGARTGITLSNISVTITSITGYTVSEFVNGTISADWTLNGITILGAIKGVFLNVYCVITGISVKVTVPLTGVTQFFINNYYGTSIQYVSISLGSVNIIDAGLFINNVLTVGAVVVDQCRVDGVVQGQNASAFIKAMSPLTTMTNCYFNGEIEDWTNNLYNVGTFALQRSGGGGANWNHNYAYLNKFTKKLLSIVGSTDYFPNEYGYSDWYVPSKDEFTLVIAQWSAITVQLKQSLGSFFGKYITSSESDADNCWVYSDVFGWQTIGKETGTDNMGLVLIRNFTYGPQDVPVVGTQYLGGIVILKDDVAGTGLMCSLAPVAMGGMLFVFGSSGTLVGTGTAVGTGANNTALIQATTPSLQAAVNWQTYVLPTLASIFVYPIFGAIAGTLANNYYAVKADDGLYTYGNWAPHAEHVDVADIRTAATFVNWDFSTVWTQLIADSVLPTLQNNAETPWIGIKNIIRYSPSTLGVELVENSDAISVFAVGLMILDENSSTLYESIGLTHSVVLPPQFKDYALQIIPYYVILGIPNQVYTSIFQFYALNQIDTRYITFKDNVILNAALVGKDMKNIHGSLYYNGYVYGSCRTDGSIVKIDANNTAAITYCTPLTPAATIMYLDQIVFCNGFIWGTGNQTLVRIDPDTLAWDSVAWPSKNGTVLTSEPIATSHGKYLYIIGPRYVTKLDVTQLCGTTIVTDISTHNIVDATLAEYDSFTQGGYINWSGAHPELYTGLAKGLCHTAIADGINLYVAYVTLTPIAGLNIDVNGYSDILGITVHELHQISLSDMTAVSFIYIPKATDDMCQTENHIFLGCEIQAVANPLTNGYGCSIYAVNKSSLALLPLKKLDRGDNPPTDQSYGVVPYGEFLIELRTNSYLSVIDISNPDEWDMSKPTGNYTLERIKFSPASIGGPANEIVGGADTDLFYTFGWVLSGGQPAPSGYEKFIPTSSYPGKGFACTQTISAQVAP